MHVLNVHERELHATREQAGALLDTLSSRADALFPRHNWPAMKFDRPLSVGAVGGHGPIRYFVEAYVPGESIRFRFTGPAGFDGYHGFEITQVSGSTVILRHVLKMKTHGPALLSWPLIFRPLHDALIEDGLATAEVALDQPPHVIKWSPWVNLLRRVLSRGRASRQRLPHKQNEIQTEKV